ncbi:hypothetical protein CPT_Percy17 [Caulobacter phage Percy]|uniref:Uncharacterized protein n=1 Tax=Caulobacter phage Percy TaxID=1701809 RepID=A0A0M4RDG7_9CAUD|nr:hypothetical protein CPT_Percy17 [Caulobacter phage Percy]ALF01651.1 hypothetical protein CPT_Percy17 [Caulobacter phage Percy]
MTAKVYNCFNQLRKDQLDKEQARKEMEKRNKRLAKEYRKPKQAANTEA